MCKLRHSFTDGLWYSIQHSTSKVERHFDPTICIKSPSMERFVTLCIVACSSRLPVSIQWILSTFLRGSQTSLCLNQVRLPLAMVYSSLYTTLSMMSWPLPVEPTPPRRFPISVWSSPRCWRRKVESQSIIYSNTRTKLSVHTKRWEEMIISRFWYSNTWARRK